MGTWSTWLIHITHNNNQGGWNQENYVEKGIYKGGEL